MVWSGASDKDADRSVSGIPAELLEEVRRLEIRVRRIVEELFSGEYHSVFKGQGMEFQEVREYHPGDDIRSIDWNVTARMRTPYIKKYEEERELTVMIVADLSASEHFGSQQRLKSAALAELGALLAFSAIANQDKVGLILFTDSVELYIPPKKGRSHVLRLVREMIYHPPRSKKTNVEEALITLNRVQKRKAVVFLLSDFLADGYDQALSVSARRHDLIAMNLFDPRERELPSAGLVRLQDAETGEYKVVDCSDGRLRQMYLEAGLRREQELKRRLKKAGCDVVHVDVSQSVVDPLQRFFLKRERRRR